MATNHVDLKFKSERAYQLWECGRHRERSPKPLSREFESLLPCQFCGSEGEVNSQASHKRPVAGLSPAAATKGRVAASGYVARAL